MANRDHPVNGKRSKLSLQQNGNLFLTDAGKYIITIWSSDSVSDSPSHLRLHDNGNLVLLTPEGLSLWESFGFPTDTLLPQQPLTRYTKLVSSTSPTNYSTGFYSLFFDYDNILRLLYDGPGVSSTYWPAPWLTIWDAGRSPFNNTRIASFDHLGNFSSSDFFTALSTDYGAKLQRILKMDPDGNLRLYSRAQPQEDDSISWVVTWQALSQTCQTHGVCGLNSFCSYVPGFGRNCSCLPGYEMRNQIDWSDGCRPEFDSNLFCNNSKPSNLVDFMHLPHVDFYGYDYKYYPNTTLSGCKSLCSELCNCTGFLYKFDMATGVHGCYPKAQLRNGYRSPDFPGGLYVKLPKSVISSYNINAREPNMCAGKLRTREIDRRYETSRAKGSVILHFAAGLGGVEIVCVFVVWYFLSRKSGREREDSDVVVQGYIHAASGFRRFSYSELKKATRGFTQEIGRGGGGIVYKGLLCDQRVAAIKQLHAASNQGEAEFLAEVSLIGKLYHMNLIEMWGYCVEKKHRLLVYEYMEHGSLAEKISSNVLDWKNKFEIAVGTAKGLAYLHEECLEWVLHCDIKPQNILLDSNYNPKVADFGLSKLLDRSQLINSNFSRIRGTRGYMAPEWVYNKPITSKVDVYSYGIVVLEMLTGKSPAEIFQAVEGGAETQKKMTVTWVREKMTNGEFPKEETQMGAKFDKGKLELLVRVALQCLEEDRDARPTMSQVVEILVRHENK